MVRLHYYYITVHSITLLLHFIVRLYYSYFAMQVLHRNLYLVSFLLTWNKLLFRLSIPHQTQVGLGQLRTLEFHDYFGGCLYQLHLLFSVGKH